MKNFRSLFLHLFVAITAVSCTSSVPEAPPLPDYKTPAWADHDLPVWPESPPDHYVTYHLAHPGPGRISPGRGNTGDPNAAFYYKGRYHLHYIYKTEINEPVYAHVSSTDMLHWKWHPTVLTEKSMGHGMFSGTGFFTKEGKPAIIYHGLHSNRNQIAYALDDNLDKWSKPEAIEPKDANGEIPEMRHWDPDIWMDNDSYYALSGGGDAQLMKSNDLKNWTHLGSLLHPDFPEDLGVPKHTDISCANMFKIGNKWMLLCISHTLGCRYYLGDFRDEQYLPDFHGFMNWKKHGDMGSFFAPESFLTKDGRRVMQVWLRLGTRPANTQSLPRELSLPEDGVLRIKPLRELEELRHGEKTKRNITLKKNKPHMLSDISGDNIELKVKFAATLANSFGVNVLCDKEGNKGLKIAYNAKSKVLEFGDINPPFELKKDEDLTLRIFIDKDVVEVFVNDRQAAANGHKYDPNQVYVNLFADQDGVQVKEVKSWKMKAIYK